MKPPSLWIPMSCLLALASPASAQPTVVIRTHTDGDHAHMASPASGVLLQALLGGSGLVASDGGQASFVAVPMLRVGYLGRHLAVAANVSYFSVSVLTGEYQAAHVMTIGPDVMPYLWRSAYDRARLYVLGGFNLGGTFHAPRVGDNFSNLTGGFTLGVGGQYFLHRNFALGVELGSRTQFARVQVAGGDTELTATSSFYAALSGSFVAGR